MSDYLTTQIITYMGNKRKLLSKIEEIIVSLEKENGRKLTMALFITTPMANFRHFIKMAILDNMEEKTASI